MNEWKITLYERQILKISFEHFENKVLINYGVGRLGKQLMDRYGKNRLVDIVWEGEGGMNWESRTETYAFSSVQSLSHIRLFAIIIELLFHCYLFGRSYSVRLERKWQPTPVFLPGESHE